MLTTLIYVGRAGIGSTPLQEGTTHLGEALRVWRHTRGPFPGRAVNISGDAFSIDARKAGLSGFIRRQISPA